MYEDLYMQEDVAFPVSVGTPSFVYPVSRPSWLVTDQLTVDVLFDIMYSEGRGRSIMPIFVK